MGTANCLWTLVLLGSWIINSAWCQSLPAVTEIDCITGSSLETLTETEGYEGDIERINLVAVVSPLVLQSTSCPVCLSFLVLNETVGSTSATVRTKKPLDAEELTDTGSLSYSILCTDSGVRYERIVTVTDVNEYAPEFEKDLYLGNVSEYAPWATVVTQVHAVDKDATPAHNTVFYSIEPDTDTFYMGDVGHIYLEKRLDSSVTTLYELNVKAQDPQGKSSNTTVKITVLVKPGPYFQHKNYNASIPENQVVSNLVVDPAPVQAYNGDPASAENFTIHYSIHTVSPTEYSEAFEINKITGAIGVRTELDGEKTSTVQLVLRASYELYPHKIADVQLVVQVENVKEAPVFSLPVYTSNIVTTVPPKYPVVKVQAIDPDVGQTEMLQYSLVEPISSLFDIEPSSGQIYVVSKVHTGTVTLKVKATDPDGLHDTATVEVTIKDPDNVVQISINKPPDTVRDKVHEIEKALEKALGLQVTVVSVTDSSGNAVISFIAMETGGNVVPPEEVNNVVEENKEELLEELKGLFGSDTELIGDGGGPDIIAIVVGTLLGTAGLGGITIAGLFMVKRKLSRKASRSSKEDIVNFNKTNKKRASQTSMEDIVNFNQKRGSQTSMEDIVNFNK